MYDTKSYTEEVLSIAKKALKDITLIGKTSSVVVKELVNSSMKLGTRLQFLSVQKKLNIPWNDIAFSMIRECNALGDILAVGKYDFGVEVSVVKSELPITDIDKIFVEDKLEYNSTQEGKFLDSFIKSQAFLLSKGMRLSIASDLNRKVIYINEDSSPILKLIDRVENMGGVIPKVFEILDASGNEMLVIQSRFSLLYTLMNNSTKEKGYFIREKEARIAELEYVLRSRFGIIDVNLVSYFDSLDSEHVVFETPEYLEWEELIEDLEFFKEERE